MDLINVLVRITAILFNVISNVTYRERVKNRKHKNGHYCLKGYMK